MLIEHAKVVLVSSSDDVFFFKSLTATLLTANNTLHCLWLAFSSHELSLETYSIQIVHLPTFKFFVLSVDRPSLSTMAAPIPSISTWNWLDLPEDEEPWEHIELDALPLFLEAWIVCILLSNRRTFFFRCRCIWKMLILKRAIPFNNINQKISGNIT